VGREGFSHPKIKKSEINKQRRRKIERCFECFLQIKKVKSYMGRGA